jgi:hypothetical protein
VVKLEADFEVRGTWRGGADPVWPTQVDGAYVEDGVVGACGEDRTKRQVGHKHLLHSNKAPKAEVGPVEQELLWREVGVDVDVDVEDVEQVAD